MDYQRTPDECFADLPDYPFAPNYLTVGTNGMRMHYVDAGAGEPVVLLLHGEPSWSYLYRHMIARLVDAGFRCIAPDLIGFGKSDKPVYARDYTYQHHIDWVKAVLHELDLTDIHLFCQDWGGLIGLRIVAEEPVRFTSVTASNTFLPTGREQTSDAFGQWLTFSQQVPEFPVSGVLQMGTTTVLDGPVLAAYDAPFPEESYKVGARVFPALVPTGPEDPEADNNQRAWAQLAKFQRPFLTLFGDADPITQGASDVFQAKIPGCHGQPHRLIAGGGHFIQEDAPEELCGYLIPFLRSAG